MVTNLTNLIENTSISIDSLQIRIPLILCDLEHTDLKEKKYIVSVDGEQVGTIEPTKHINSYSGITVIYRIKKVPTWNRNTGKNYYKPCLCIGIPSKVLKSSYLGGITAKNLPKVYQYLKSLNIALFDYSIFKDSLCTDIDFKCDFNISEFDYIDFDSFIKDLESISKSPKQRNLGPNKFNERLNKGIEFQTRENTYKNVQYPYLKFYNKRLELASQKSREFKDTYLNGQTIKDCRIETTVKDKKHLRSLGIKDTSLNSLVTLDKKHKEKILLNAINRNLTGGIIQKEAKEPKGLRAFEKLFCLMAKNPCMGLDDAFALYKRTTSDSRQVQSILKKKVEKLRPYC